MENFIFCLQAQFGKTYNDTNIFLLVFYVAAYLKRSNRTSTSMQICIVLIDIPCGSEIPGNRFRQRLIIFSYVREELSI